MTTHIIIIAGPTASGKSHLAEKLAAEYGGHIINADMAQMYTQLSVGTAKPDWQTSSIPQHLFDIVTTPTDTSVVAYRAMVIEKVNELSSLNKPIIIVGGSFFYLTSLFYPPLPIIKSDQPITMSDSSLSPWEKLNLIDSDRARELHPNDIYRIERALSIWKTTGIKPSLNKPVYAPPFHATIICINPHRNLLYQRINERTITMMHSGWIEETEAIVGTTWEPFVATKGFIGYPEVLTWIHQGKNKQTLSDVITTIQQKTRTYAKRQVTFWHKLSLMLKKEPNPLPIYEFSSHERITEIKNSLCLDK